MKNKIIVLFIFIVSTSFGQSLYKGLNYGMSKKEAVAAFKADRDSYTTVDLGNNFLYRIYQQNFIYEDGKLVAISFNPKGSALGMEYNDAVNYLEYTRSVFEQLDYTVFYESEYWNAPINYHKNGSLWGLVMENPEKTKIVQMYPGLYNPTGTISYLMVLRMWDRDTWMNLYNKSQSKRGEKIKNSGF